MKQMRRVGTLGVVVMMLAVLAMAVTVTAQPAQHTINFSQNDLTFSQSEGGDLVEYDLVEAGFRGNMCSFEGEPGAPWLPACDVHILLPAGVEVSSLEASVGEKVALDGTYNIHPAQPPYILSGDPPPFVAPDPDVYDSSSAIPDKVAELMDTMVIRGYHIAVVRVYPLVYVPATGQLSLRTTFNLGLNVEGTGGVLSYGAPEPTFEDFVKGDVINAEELGAEYETAQLLSPVDPNDVKYLLIGDSSMLDEFQPLLAWKTKKGVPAEAVSVDWVYSNYSGSTNQRQIKECIKDYVQNKGTVWVVLAGDSTIVPDYDCYVNVSGVCEDSTIPTDSYYMGLDDMDWNDDGDGRACETSGDSIDLGPDVFVGRLGIRTEAHATAIVNKILQYEKTILQADFAEKLLLAGVELWNAGDAEAKSELMYEDYIEPYWSGTRYRFYDTATDFSGGSSYAVNISHVNEQLGNGYNYFHMATHGNTTVWGMESGSSYSSSYASSVSNPNKYANIATIACITNAFDYSTDPCLSEAFIRNSDGGAVTYIGSSRYGLGYSGTSSHGPSFQYDRMIYKFLFTGEPAGFSQQVGAVYAKAKEYWAGDSDEGMRWVQMSLNLLGDPEMPLYTYNPSTFSPTYASSITMGSQTYVVETGAADARVCLIKGSEVYACGSANSSGHFEASINPTTEGTMDVTITKLNYYPHEGTVSVSGGTPPPPTDTPTVTPTPGPTDTPTNTPTPEPPAPILLVDDDDGSSYEGYYTAALDALGKDYDTWSVQSQGSPSASELQKHDIVVWFTGDDYTTTLSSTDQSNLTTYLDGGGNLFITGQDIGYDINTASFYGNYLHASYVQDDTNTYGLTGYDILDGVNVTISGSGGANNQSYPSEIGLGSGAVGLFDYDGSYTWGGLRWEGAYRLVYLSFGYEAIDTSADRNSVMDALLNWLEGGAPPPTPTNTPTSVPPTPTGTPTPTGVPPTPTDTPTGVPPTPTTTPEPGVVFSDDFESDKGWEVDPSGSDTATTGTWERANPEGTEYSGVSYQLDTTASGSYDLVTGPLAGSSVGSYDIDGGDTTIRSPNIALPSGQSLTLSFSYYLAHLDNATSDDYLRVKVVGSTTTTVFEELGSGDDDEAVWASFNCSLDAFAGQTVYLLVEAADGGGGSLVEAAIDDVSITSSGPVTPTPTPTNTPTPEPTPTHTPTPTPGPGPIFSDDFESDLGWTTDPEGSDTATTGLWERANPEGTEYSGVSYQLGTTASGSYDLVTGPLAGSSVGSYDIDGGDTTIRSPDIALPSGGSLTLSFSYYLAHLSNATSDDYLQVKVVGSTTTTVFEELGSGDDDGAVWASFNCSLDAFAGQTVYLLVEAADGGSGSLVEAAIDDVSITSG